jgi:hypothetical protein
MMFGHFGQLFRRRQDFFLLCEFPQVSSMLLEWMLQAQRMLSRAWPILQQQSSNATIAGHYKNADQLSDPFPSSHLRFRSSISKLHHLMVRDPARSPFAGISNPCFRKHSKRIDAVNNVLDTLLVRLERFNSNSGQSLGLAPTRGLKVKQGGRSLDIIQ